MEVDKGIAEARLVKKKHVEELRLLEQPDPDWLREQDEQEKKKVRYDCYLLKLILLNCIKESVEEEDRPREEKREESKEEKKEESTSEIRQRTKKGEERFNVEHVLQHHRQMHDELTSDLSRMAQQLKKNSQVFGDTLSKDDIVLRDAQKAVENNLKRMTTERQRLDEHYSKSWNTSFMTIGVVLFVCIMFILVFFTIKFLPKA